MHFFTNFFSNFLPNQIDFAKMLELLGSNEDGLFNY